MAQPKKRRKVAARRPTVLGVAGDPVLQIRERQRIEAGSETGAGGGRRQLIAISAQGTGAQLLQVAHVG